MLFLSFFSISPIPSRTLVMSYIRLFCTCKPSSICICLTKENRDWDKKDVPSVESSRSVQGLGKGVSGKPYPRLCNARRLRLEPGTFRSQAVRLYRLHQARPSWLGQDTKKKEAPTSRVSAALFRSTMPPGAPFSKFRNFFVKSPKRQ